MCILYHLVSQTPITCHFTRVTNGYFTIFKWEFRWYKKIPLMHPRVESCKNLFVLPMGKYVPEFSYKIEGSTSKVHQFHMFILYHLVSQTPITCHFTWVTNGYFTIFKWEFRWYKKIPLTHTRVESCKNLLALPMGRNAPDFYYKIDGSILKVHQFHRFILYHLVSQAPITFSPCN